MSVAPTFEIEVLDKSFVLIALHIGELFPVPHIPLRSSIHNQHIERNQLLSSKHHEDQQKLVLLYRGQRRKRERKEHCIAKEFF